MRCHHRGILAPYHLEHLFNPEPRLLFHVDADVAALADGAAAGRCVPVGRACADEHNGRLGAAGVHAALRARDVSAETSGGLRLRVDFFDVRGSRCSLPRPLRGRRGLVRPSLSEGGHGPHRHHHGDRDVHRCHRHRRRPSWTLRLTLETRLLLRRLLLLLLLLLMLLQCQLLRAGQWRRADHPMAEAGGARAGKHNRLHVWEGAHRRPRRRHHHEHGHGREA
mmetsp:Transcript_50891/g.148243  ORF Transcript_50891/g.148243 Transcript_50891/m.148243 type:complete len:223 (+) Transcript_50891:1169-1837(+)